MDLLYIHRLDRELIGSMLYSVPPGTSSFVIGKALTNILCAKVLCVGKKL